MPKKAQPPYPLPPWRMSRDYFYENSTFHGTTKKNGRNLIKTQKPDLEMFGTGGDRNFLTGRAAKRSMFASGVKPGFYGRGFYVSKDTGGATTYSNLRSSGMLLRCIIEPGSLLENPDKVDLDVLKRHYMDGIIKARAEKMLPPMDDERLQGYAGMLDIDPMYSYTRVDMNTYISAVNAWAVSQGYKGCAWMKGSETCIWDVSAVQCIAEAEKTYEELIAGAFREWLEH